MHLGYVGWLDAIVRQLPEVKSFAKKFIDAIEGGIRTIRHTCEARGAWQRGESGGRDGRTK